MSKKVGGLASWSVQLDSPVTNSEWVDHAWGGGEKLVGEEGDYFDTTLSVSSSVH